MNVYECLHLEIDQQMLNTNNSIVKLELEERIVYHHYFDLRQEINTLNNESKDDLN